VDSPPRLGPPGAVPPVDPLEDPAKRRTKQGPKRRLAYRPRARMCLLKGCGSWFEPECPQQRYCPGACVEAAGAWSAWKARCRYRESPKGRRARQKGSREYRTRRAARENLEGGVRRPARQRASPVWKLSPLPMWKLSPLPMRKRPPLPMRKRPPLPMRKRPPLPMRKLSPLPMRKRPPLRPRSSRGSALVPASTLVSLRPTWRLPGS